jgi:hypothetical protein
VRFGGELFAHTQSPGIPLHCTFIVPRIKKKFGSRSAYGFVKTKLHKRPGRFLRSAIATISSTPYPQLRLPPTHSTPLPRPFKSSLFSQSSFRLLLLGFACISSFPEETKFTTTQLVILSFLPCSATFLPSKLFPEISTKVRHRHRYHFPELSVFCLESS